MSSITPGSGQLTLDIRVSAEVNISAEVARRKVTGFVADTISTTMHGGEPTLTIGERICSRIPVILSMPPIGDRGEVGAVEVDVETGQMNITTALIEEIERRAEYLATRSSSAST
jgi:hypothetical protein